MRLLEAAVLKGLVATGTAEGLHAIGLNSADAADWRGLAYNSGVEALAAAAGPVGGVPITSFGSFMESSIIGPPPDTSTPAIPNMGAHESARFVLNALLADGVPVEGIDPKYLVNDTHADGTPFQRIGSIEELTAAGRFTPTDTDLQGELNGVLDRVVGSGDNPAPPFAQKYEDIIKISDAKK